MQIVFVVVLHHGYPGCDYSDDPRSPCAGAVKAANLHPAGGGLMHPDDEG